MSLAMLWSHMAAKQAKKCSLLAGPFAVPDKTLVVLLSKRGIFCHRSLEEMNVAGPKGCVGTVSGKRKERDGWSERLCK